MKKIVKVVLVLSLFLFLAGCSKAPADKEELTKLVVGATPVPHSEILNEIKEDLKAKGIELEIKEFTDYVTPNTALKDKQIDANFFQHQPYLDSFTKEGYENLVSVAGIHIEPMGGYSTKIKTFEELSPGATVAIPNDATNEGRALLLLAKQGLITLNDPTNLTATPLDIVNNPKNLKFAELEAAQLPRALQDVELAVINTNYALEADLNPMEDNLFIEDSESPYVNILVAREDNKDSEAMKILIETLQTEKVENFILTKYQGAVVPAFSK